MESKFLVYLPSLVKMGTVELQLCNVYKQRSYEITLTTVENPP